MTTSGIFAIVGGLVLLAIIGATVRALITDGYGRRATTRPGLARLREQREDADRDSAPGSLPRTEEAPVAARARSSVPTAASRESSAASAASAASLPSRAFATTSRPVASSVAARR